MILAPLTKEQMEEVRIWRMSIPETLRTPYDLTKEQQEEYYDLVLCDRRSTTRYFAFLDSEKFIGMGGIENISWENSNGEISILINPAYRNLGWGKTAVDAVLDYAFDRLNLNSVWGECYTCSPAISFWVRRIKEKNAFSTTLLNRKYYKGRYWPSLYFMFERKPECEVTE